jgi:putative DNA primase/helicase
MTAAVSKMPFTKTLYPDAIPAELKMLPQWVAWRLIVKPDGRTTKVPINVNTGTKASSTDPSTWVSFARALAYYNRGQEDGIGFVFTSGDPYIGFDRDEVDGEDPFELDDLVDEMNTYAETSPSGNGIHIIGKGKLPIDTGKHPKGLGIFEHSRFFTMTGDLVGGKVREIRSVQHVIDQKWESWFPVQPTPAPLPNQNAHLDDEDIISLALSAANGAKFRALWDGDTSGHNDNASEADLALLSILSFYTQDAGHLDRLFRQSGLYREKWERRDYRERTIAKALERTEFYTPRGSFRLVNGGKADSPPPDDAPPVVTKSRRHDYNLTDTGNAERLVARHGANIRFNYSREVWHVWTGTHWGEDAAGQMDQLAKDTVRSIPVEAIGLEGEAYTKRLKWAAASESAGKRSAMIELARSEPGIPVTADELDLDPWLLNVANGTLDLRTCQLRPHRREDKITRCLSTPYQPDATCPTFLAFLDHIFAGNTELIAYIQRMIGYSLTGSIREQAIYIAFGNGSNGKSTLLGIISKLLEAYATEADTDSFLERQGDRIREDVAALEGARFVSASETADGKRLSEAFVKKATGGEKLRARRLFENGYTFEPKCKVWLSTNHRPQIIGTDHAIWRRIRLIPFAVTIPDSERDRDLPKKLESELPGILSWAIEGCRQWLANGEQPPATVLQATEQYRRDMDALANWLEDRCHLRNGARTPAKDLYADYVAYCNRQGEEPLKQRTFGSRLTERGCGEAKSGATRYRTNIRLINPDDPEQTTLGDDSCPDWDVRDTRDATYRKFSSDDNSAYQPETNVPYVPYVPSDDLIETEDDDPDWALR